MIVLQPPLVCERWGGHPLCLSRDSSVRMDLHWPCSCTAQSSILSIGSVFLERIMTDALEDHEGTVSIGGRTITNLRFADDIDGLAGEPAVGSCGRRN